MSVNEPGEDVGPGADPGAAVTQITDHLRLRLERSRNAARAEKLDEPAEWHSQQGLEIHGTAGYGGPVGRSTVSGTSARTEGGGLLQAVGVILLSRLPDQPPAPRSALDTVLGARLRVAGSMSMEAATGYTTALIWSMPQYRHGDGLGIAAVGRTRVSHDGRPQDG